MGSALLLLLATLGAAAPDPLAAYRGTARVLVLLAPAANDPALLQQRALLAPHAAELAERDVTVLEDPTLARRLGTDPAHFAAVLVGKDGGVKLRRNRPLDFATLAATVDAMPMRRDEMRARTQ